MIRLVALAAFAIAVTTSAHAIPVAQVHEPDSMITQVVAACGVGMTRVNGVCVSRTAQTSSSQVCPMGWKHLREILLRDKAITARDGIQLQRAVSI